MDGANLNQEEQDSIEVVGARVHNLKNINVSFPRNQLVVITGLSGSGKSSLAFDTIYAEGQRRYMETFSAYARQFLGNMDRPDVDKISGLSPVIAIEQKTTTKNPRSTVGTVTEIYDFMRLLYARIGEAYSYATDEKMEKLSEDQIFNVIFKRCENTTIFVLAPLVKGRKGHYRELFEDISKGGYLKVRVDGTILDIKPNMQLDRYRAHDIEVVIDRLSVNQQNKKRLYASIEAALKMAKGTIKIIDENHKEYFFSKHLIDPTTGISYDEPQPNTFSFNSPYGACERCDGLGYIYEANLETIIPNPKLSIKDGAIALLGPYNKEAWDFVILQGLSKKYNFSLTCPIEELPKDIIELILYGVPGGRVTLPIPSPWGVKESPVHFKGILSSIESTKEYRGKESKEYAELFAIQTICPECNGARLKKESLHFKIDHKNIYELTCMDLNSLSHWFKGLEKRLNERQNIIAKELLKEIRARLSFLLQVNLSYLNLARSAKTLSGGEAQRIRLATQIGSQLVNVLYILDEPSIGLHQRDNAHLIRALKSLRDLGNSVLVVEHDKDMILEADYVIDMGPAAGEHGGQVVAQGTAQEIKATASLTASYLNGTRTIPVPKKRRKGYKKLLILTGAQGNNLKKVSVKFPLGTFICVTGVSGSGKSSLIGETLYPILNQHFFKSKKRPLPYEKVEGLPHVDKVIEIDQTPIGRTPRSNPSTYTGVFADIRNLFVQLPEAKIRGYKPGRFSFNVKGGRCEECQGGGMKIIEMNFLPDVQVVCEVCQGKRYNRETLEVRYRGKSISDVLNMSVEEALAFFVSIPVIYRKIKTLYEVGLGYVKLGQSSTTLSGGEAQRVKLSTELSKRDTGRTFYILDEPTTGLHFEDVNMLLQVLNRLVDRENTVLVIEHNMDVIKNSDWVIDLGPEGGDAGGHILFAGTPEDLINAKGSQTGKFLKIEMGR